MTSPVYSIGISALQTARLALQTTSNNVANANTEGYSRQRVEQSSSLGQFTGGLWVGTGVTINQVSRSYDAYLESSVRSNTASSSYYSTMNNQMTPMDELLSDSNAGIGAFMDQFQSSLSDLAQRPSDTAARQLVLSNARALVQRFNSFGDQVDQVRSDVEAKLSDSVQSINQKTGEIVQLNKQIADQMYGNGGLIAKNDLLDQRDLALRQLAEKIGVSAVSQPDGTINVFMSNGQALVVGENQFKVGVVPSPSNPDVTSVGVEVGNGQIVAFKPAELQGSGELGGLLNFRDGALADVEQRLDALAANFGAEFNRVHAQGVDLTGTAGGEMFSLGSPRAVALAGTAQLTVSMPTSAASAGGFPAGPYDLTATGSGFELRQHGGSTVLASSAGLPMTMMGMTIDVASGTINAGDSFLIESSSGAASAMQVLISDPNKIAAAQGPTLTGVSDNRNALQLSGLMRAKLAEGGTASFQQSLSGLIGDFATKVSEAKTVGKAQDAMLQQATKAQQEVSGVNLDEEAANLIRYQQAYQAASQVMKAASEMFDTILSIARG